MLTPDGKKAMSKKQVEQLKINEKCDGAHGLAIYELNTEHPKAARLRTCSAVVYTTTNYYILKSYATIISVINKNTHTCYDFLRMVYGFTRTSAQHISKFEHDYNAAVVYTARNI